MKKLITVTLPHECTNCGRNPAVWDVWIKYKNSYEYEHLFLCNECSYLAIPDEEEQVTIAPLPRRHSGVYLSHSNFDVSCDFCAQKAEKLIHYVYLSPYSNLELCSARIACNECAEHAHLIVNEGVPSENINSLSEELSLWSIWVKSVKILDPISITFKGGQ